MSHSLSTSKKRWHPDSILSSIHLGTRAGRFWAKKFEAEAAASSEELVAVSEGLMETSSSDKTCGLIGRSALGFSVCSLAELVNNRRWLDQ